MPSNPTRAAPSPPPQASPTPLRPMVQLRTTVTLTDIVADDWPEEAENAGGRDNTRQGQDEGHGMARGLERASGCMGMPAYPSSALSTQQGPHGQDAAAVPPAHRVRGGGFPEKIFACATMTARRVRPRAHGRRIHADRPQVVLTPA